MYRLQAASKADFIRWLRAFSVIFELRLIVQGAISKEIRMKSAEKSQERLRKIKDEQNALNKQLKELELVKNQILQ